MSLNYYYNCTLDVTQSASLSCLTHSYTLSDFALGLKRFGSLVLGLSDSVSGVRSNWGCFMLRSRVRPGARN